METQNDNKIALLIDADNAQAELIINMLAEAGKHGKVTIRRIYGNWTDTKLSSWKEQINKHSIRPIQKFSLGKGKNSTDTAMIIDAMDILYSKNVNGFCIASSDSDYTGLAQRIREEGVFVMGIGQAGKTAEAFINACDLFVFAENITDSLVKKEVKVTGDKKPNKPGESKAENNLNPKNVKENLPLNKITKQPIDLTLILKAFEMAVNDNGLAYMGVLGGALRKLEPSFDCRTFGSSTMTGLFKRLPNMFEMVYEDNGSSLFVKLKNIK